MDGPQPVRAPAPQLSRLQRLDRYFGVAPRGTTFWPSERSELVDAIAEGRNDRLDPELVARGRAWAREVLGPRARRNSRAMVVLYSVVILIGVVLLAFVDRHNVWLALVWALNIPIQLLVRRHLRRQARAILAGYPPRPD